MMTRPLTNDDRAALEALLLEAPDHNAFHLSAVHEFGLTRPTEPGGEAWAVGVFRDSALAGAVVVLRGTGGIYHHRGDRETLEPLADAVLDAVMSGRLALLSGHTSQIGALMPLVESAVNGRPDRCDFCTLAPGDIITPSPIPGFNAPVLATGDDMERLIDFYQRGFYSLARLPSRAAWRSRLSEQIAFRSLYFIADASGTVISSALSSAESRGSAMLGGVATLPEYRGQGLSTWCVAALCEHLFRREIPTISLFYLKDNTSAARVYARLGFSPSGEWLLVPMGLGILFGSL
jgi:GNAT superfamily N-acetyltransferase